MENESPCPAVSHMDILSVLSFRCIVFILKSTPMVEMKFGENVLSA